MISFGTVRKEMGMKTFDIEQYSRDKGKYAC